MAQKQTVIVVVSKEWMDTGVRHLVNHGATSRSTSSTHILIGDVEDTSDQRGLWLKNVKTAQLTADRSTVSMKFIFGLGLLDDEPVKPRPGFPSEGTQTWDEPLAGD